MRNSHGSIVEICAPRAIKLDDSGNKIAKESEEKEGRDGKNERGAGKEREREKIMHRRDETEWREGDLTTRRRARPNGTARRNADAVSLVRRRIHWRLRSSVYEWTPLLRRVSFLLARSRSHGCARAHVPRRNCISKTYFKIWREGWIIPVIENAHTDLVISESW